MRFNAKMDTSVADEMSCNARSVPTTAITPIAMLLMFVYVFGGAIDTGGAKYVNYLLPGILLITVASGVAYTALRLYTDVSSGIFERFQSMPIARSGVRAGPSFPRPRRKVPSAPIA